MRLTLTILTLGLLLTLQSCSTRNDKIFNASDELHYITLYKDGHNFEILYNGVNTATGTYTLENDTIFLTYTKNQFKEFDPNEVLTRRILIDERVNKVRSLDDKLFCADIHLDERELVD